MLVLSSTSAYRHVPQRPASSPIPLTILAEMPRLIYVVIVEVAELGVQAITSRTWKGLVWLFEDLTMGRVTWGIFSLGLIMRVVAINSDFCN